MAWDGPTITISGARGDEWEKATGTRVFPIMEPSLENCELGPPDATRAPCFMLAIAALTGEQQQRIIDHLARKWGTLREGVARDFYSIGVPIRDGPDIQVNVPPGWQPRRRLAAGPVAFDNRFFT